MKLDLQRYQGENGTEIEFLYKPPKTQSDVMVIVFPTHAPDIPTKDTIINYLFTLLAIDCHRLFLSTNTPSHAGYYIAMDGDYAPERTLMTLINSLQQKNGIKRIICAGTCRGGLSCQYYGLKYGYDIIVGSVDVPFSKNHSKVFYGNNTPEAQAMALNIMPDLLKKAKNSYSGRIVLVWGEQEDTAGAASMKQFVKDLSSVEIDSIVYTPNFSEHRMIANYFPKILVEQLAKIIMASKTSDMLYHDSLDVWFQSIKAKLVTLEKYTIPPLSLGCPVSNVLPFTSGNFRKMFEYALKDYFFVGEYKADGHKFASISYLFEYMLKNDIQTFWNMNLQAQLLFYYKQTNNIKAFEILEDLMMEFWKIQAIEAPKHRGKKGNFVYEKGYRNIGYIFRRVNFLLDYHAALSNNNLKTSFDTSNRITEELMQSFLHIINYDLFIYRSLDFQMLFSCQRALLHIAAYFKNNKDFFSDVFGVVMSCTNDLLDLEFDGNGFCLGGLGQTQHWYAQKYEELASFITANGFPASENYLKFSASLEKIIVVTQHIIRPDKKFPMLGITGELPAHFKPSFGNLINAKSNIAILNGGSAYLTINSGPQVHIRYPHHDQLSFTFFYDNISFVADSGEAIGVKDELAKEYCRSAVAHSALICNDSDYEISPYAEITSIKKIIENDEYVIVVTGHQLYEGVTLSRVFVWVKPNVLVLFDRAESTTEHKYTQNFLFNPPKQRQDGENYTEFKRTDRDTFRVTQYDGGYNLEVYKGQTTFDPENPRGIIFFDQKSPSPVLNFAYNITGNVARFATVLEAHSGKENEISVALEKDDDGAYTIKVSENTGSPGFIISREELGGLL
jgi:hypothetical protein